MFLKTMFILTLQCSCRWSMRLPDSIYITTESPVPVPLKTELYAPAASSVSQYFQQPNSQSRSLFAQPGPLYFLMLGNQPSAKQNFDDRINQDSYQLYRPEASENPQFVDMLAPKAEQNEPNYYVIKPKKNKKAVDAAPTKKYKKFENLKEKIVEANVPDHEASPTENDYEDYDRPEYSIHHDELDQHEDSDHNEDDQESDSRVDSEEAADQSPLSTDASEESQEQDSSSERSNESVETSNPSSRLDFQMHGHKGPGSYKFGYGIPGQGFKVEEKDENGNVLGQYGYHDDDGKLRIVKYSAMADDGFRVL